MKKIYIFLLLAVMALGASAQHGRYVGGDISLIPSYEASKTVYLDGQGNNISDLITWLRNDCEWNCFRVRLFVNPQKKGNDGKFDPAVCQDIEYVKALGKRIKDSGAYFMLDIHYSDTYVDATHIQAPAVCQSMTVDEKAEWIYNYTKESLQTLQTAGATPDLVQVGNEIMYGFMGIKVAPYENAASDWTGYLKVLKQGCQAVRDCLPKAKIIIHTDRACNTTYDNFYYSKLDAAQVPYDVIGLSYYPFWHGWLTAHPDKYNDGLGNALTYLKNYFPSKEVQIVETAYNFQYWPSSGVNYDTRDTWECSDAGQYQFVCDLISELANHTNVTGLMYWCPEEAGCGDAANWDTNEGVVITSWINRGLWWSNSSNGHWPIKNAGSQYKLKEFLDPNPSAITSISADSKALSGNTWYSITGARQQNTPSQTGLYINNGKKVIVK